MPAALQIVQNPEKAAVLLQPGRLDLLVRLAEPDSAAGLARRMGMPRQKVNYHLRELEREGFVELFEERRKGNCLERVVRATAREICDLAAICLRAGKARKRVATLTLETEIRFATAESRSAFADELTATI